MTRLLLAATIVTVTLNSPSAQQGTFRTRTDVVAIDVSVLDGRKPVTTLTIKDFRLTDDGVTQTLLDVGREPKPLDITLTIDVSGSVTPEKRATIERAIQQIAATLRPDDRCSVVSFGPRIIEESPLQPPPPKVALIQREGGTSFVDALLLAQVTAPAIGRRQLNLILTDGIDTTSFFDPQRVLDTMRYGSSQTSVVLVRGRNNPVSDEVSRKLVNQVTAISGGQVVVLDRDDQLNGAFLRALDEFRTSYLLTFTPTGVSREGWHPVIVTVAGRNYTIRARQGYWFSSKSP